MKPTNSIHTFPADYCPKGHFSALREEFQEFIDSIIIAPASIGSEFPVLELTFTL